MNTRIQVEHPITEVTHSNLDLVEMMIIHGIAKHENKKSPITMDQKYYDGLYQAAKDAGQGYAMEGRIYAENPAEAFMPSPGLLQYVHLEEKYEWLRIDSWVSVFRPLQSAQDLVNVSQISTGTQVTLHFDPLLCKIIVHGGTREEAISRFLAALEECEICGPPNNMDYLKVIATSPTYQAGRVTTRFLDTLEYSPRYVATDLPLIDWANRNSVR